MKGSSDTLLDEGEEHPDESALLDFSAGRLGVAAADGLVVHLDGCSRCRQMLSSLTRSSQVIGDDGPPEDLPTRVGADVLIGQLLGEYRVLERINQGGMGILYRGEQPQIGKAVAIKVLLPQVAADPNLVHRLLGEARAVNSIRHPNIIDIFALGQLPDGRHYMVMELLQGKSLGELLKERGRLQATEACLVLEQAMGALQAAHLAGVIHRDLKPENIFVNPLADGWRVTLLDFGLAKQQGSLNLTAPDLVLGTPGYMAPEQIRGSEATPAIDVYAMGIVAWQLLTGREPYSGGSMIQVMKRHLDAPVPQLRTLVPGVPPGLEALVLKMMGKDPATRPTAEEVLKGLARLSGDPRRDLQYGELTQLVSPDLPLTAPEGLPPVRTTTRPDRPPPPATLPETPAFGERAGLRRAPLIMTVLGVVLLGGAVGLVLFRAPPAQVLLATDPPAGRSRAEVERTLASSKVKAAGLAHAPTRKVVLLQLERLEERLKKDEEPGAIDAELEELLIDSQLK